MHDWGRLVEASSLEVQEPKGHQSGYCEPLPLTTCVVSLSALCGSMSEVVEDYFGDVPVPESEGEDDAANDETFGVDTDDIIAGDPDSDVAWKPGHEELAARIEHEKEAILRKQDAASETLPAETQPGARTAPPSQPQYSVQQLQSMYAHKVQAQQQHYAMVQQQQRLFADQRQHLMTQCQQYLRQNPSAGAEVQARQQQLVLQQQMQMGQLQQQAQAIHHSIVQIQGALQAYAKSAAASAPPLQGQPVLPEHEGAARLAAHANAAPGVPSARAIGARKAPGGRLEEIERQMVAAGLGPNAFGQGAPSRGNGLQESEVLLSAQAGDGTSARDPRTVVSRHGGEQSVRQTQRAVANGDGPSRGIDGRSRPGPRPSTRRRLEGMTDRDMELVLRMHLRQLETAVPYKDEYYVFALKEKEANGSVDAFKRLANIVNGMDPASTRGKRSGPKGARLSTADDDDDTLSVTSTVHTPENMSTLASALGTLQVWNPKAPRKLVDFGAGTESADGNPSRHVSFSGKLLREDDRIVVRFAVEEGYDVLAALHDVVRRKSNASVDTLIKSLFNLLRIPVKATAPVDADADAFFVRMCGFTKGKRFIARAFVVLKPRHQFAVASAVMRNLQYLAEGESASSGGDKSGVDSFWHVINSYVREGAADSWTAVDLLRRFDEAQVDQRDGVVVALRSEVGASLVYTAMQRVYGALSGNEFEEDTAANVSAVMGSLCETIDTSLGAVFQHAHSSAVVWNVLAMLDALTPPEQQAKLRGTLKRLLDEGVAPPPPAAAGNV